MPFFHSDTLLFHYLDMGKGVPFVFQHGMGGDVHPPLYYPLLRYGWVLCSTCLLVSA